MPRLHLHVGVDEMNARAKRMSYHGWVLMPPCCSGTGARCYQCLHHPAKQIKENCQKHERLTMFTLPCRSSRLLWTVCFGWPSDKLLHSYALSMQCGMRLLYCIRSCACERAASFLLWMDITVEDVISGTVDDMIVKTSMDLLHVVPAVGVVRVSLSMPSSSLIIPLYTSTDNLSHTHLHQ